MSLVLRAKTAYITVLNVALLCLPGRVEMRVILIAHTVFYPSLVPGYVPHSLSYSLEEGFDHLVGATNVSDSDELAEAAGRLCYLSWDRPNPTTRTNRGYLDNILRQQHYSVLEHASATFYIDGVSRNFTHELIRHRHLSFSEVSQRYVDVSEFPMIVPPALREVYGSDTTQISGTDRANYIGTVSYLEKQGATRKQARQAARHIFPGSLETKIIVTGNMRAWREVLQKRLQPTADLEFQEVGMYILQNLHQISPNVFRDLWEEFGSGASS